MSAVRVLESTGSSGSLQLSDGSGGFLSGSIVGNGVLINQDNTVFQLTGTIGTAEDGTYTDGLFTDFTTTTPVGTAVDRFNEVLKALAPAPAPDLDDINSEQTGTTVYLSFGASNNQSSATPAYVSVGTSAGLGSAVDVNGIYQVATSSNNIRLGAFKLDTHVTGVLNADIAANSQGNNIQNYPDFSFGNGEVGTLRLDINGTGSYDIDLTSVLIGSGGSGLGTGSYKDANGSGFVFLSTPTTGTFSNGNPFNSFKHRTGKFVVAHQSQRNGWNYARVQHILGSSTVTTNYIEWVNDNNGDALAASGQGMVFTGSGSIYMSGIKYFRSGSGKYTVNIDNAYKYVYSNTPIDFTTSTSADHTSNAGFNMPDSAMPTIDTGAGETQTKQIQISTSSNVTVSDPGYFLNGTISANTTVAHPLKSNLTNGGSASTNQILCYNSSDNSTTINETFRGEDFRIVSSSYDTQGDVSGGTWDSEIHMTGSNTVYLNGLQFYREQLRSPKQTANGGNFSTLTNGPAGNPNYSGISGLRTFYRKFQNGGDAVRDFSYTLTGTGIIEDAGTTIGSDDKFRVFFKLPSNGTDNSGWMDAATQFIYSQTSDNDGGRIGPTFDDNLSGGATNHFSLGTGSIANGDFVLARIEADSNWTGNIENMSVSFGAVGTVEAAPNVNNIDIDTAGDAANLSFGASYPKSPFVNVGTIAGNSATDVNQNYQVAGNRYGVFGPTINAKVGTINETTTGTPGSGKENYPDNAFGGGNGNLGTLKLFVNNDSTPIHTTDLSSFGSGNSLTDGSGFNLSAAAAGEDTDDLPDYTKFYRTGTYTIASGSQQDGWNYAKVVHTVGGSDSTSTYVEWVNDISNPTLTFSQVTIGNFGSNSTTALSGVKYFVNPSGSFRMRASSFYKTVYSNGASAISFPSPDKATITEITGSGVGLQIRKVAGTSMGMPLLNTGVANAFDSDLVITASFTFDRNSSIPGGTAYTAAVTGRVNHPLKGDQTASTATSNQVLVKDSISVTSTNLIESFDDEDKRLPTDVYTDQTSVSSANYDSTVSLNGGNAAYNTGLIVYNGKLRSPQNAGLGSDLGDFRDVSESGPLEAPIGNPDYSSLSTSTRVYYRWFQNPNVASKSNFSININGTGTIVPSTTALTGNNFRVFMKIPLTGASMSTGYMDLAAPFQTGQYADDDGCLDGSLTSNISGGASNNGTFGVKSVDQNEYIVIKIVADKTWSGNIDSITLSWS